MCDLVCDMSFLSSRPSLSLSLSLSHYQAVSDLFTYVSASVRAH